MNIIPLKDFWRLRLSKLLPGRQASFTWSFEYLDRLWLGDTHGFSHAMRPYSSPFRTKSIAIDMQDVSHEALMHLSEQLGIELKPSLTADECLNKYGAPNRIEEYADDRKTYSFMVGPEYEVGFTVLNAGGLVYFTMETSDVAYSEQEEA